MKGLLWFIALIVLSYYAMTLVSPAMLIVAWFSILVFRLTKLYI